MIRKDTIGNSRRISRQIIGEVFYLSANTHTLVSIEESTEVEFRIQGMFSWTVQFFA